MAILDQRRFGDDVFDLSEVVALVGRTVYLRDGRKVGVGVATADALRESLRLAQAGNLGRANISLSKIPGTAIIGA